MQGWPVGNPGQYDARQVPVATHTAAAREMTPPQHWMPPAQPNHTAPDPGWPGQPWRLPSIDPTQVPRAQPYGPPVAAPARPPQPQPHQYQYPAWPYYPGAPPVPPSWQRQWLPPPYQDPRSILQQQPPGPGSGWYPPGPFPPQAAHPHWPVPPAMVYRGDPAGGASSAQHWAQRPASYAQDMQRAGQQCAAYAAAAAAAAAAAYAGQPYPPSAAQAHPQYWPASAAPVGWDIGKGPQQGYASAKELDGWQFSGEKQTSSTPSEEVQMQVAKPANSKAERRSCEAAKRARGQVSLPGSSLPASSLSDSANTTTHIHGGQTPTEVGRVGAYNGGPPVQAIPGAMNFDPLAMWYKRYYGHQLQEAQALNEEVSSDPVKAEASKKRQRVGGSLEHSGIKLMPAMNFQPVRKGGAALGLHTVESHGMTRSSDMPSGSQILHPRLSVQPTPSTQWWMNLETCFGEAVMGKASWRKRRRVQQSIRIDAAAGSNVTGGGITNVGSCDKSESDGGAVVQDSPPHDKKGAKSAKSGSCGESNENRFSSECCDDDSATHNKAASSGSPRNHKATRTTAATTSNA